MNRIYKLIWSKIKNCYVVASELAKRKSKNGNHLAGSVVRGALAGAVFLSLTAGMCSPVLANTGTNGGYVNNGNGGNVAFGEGYWGLWHQSSGGYNIAQAKVFSGVNNLAFGTSSYAGSFSSRYNDIQSWRNAQSANIFNYYGAEAGNVRNDLINRFRTVDPSMSQSEVQAQAEMEMEFQTWLNQKDAYGNPITPSSNDFSTAFGGGAIASGAGETAIGGKAWATGGLSTAVGVGSRAEGGSSTAIGANAIVETGGSIAIGRNSHVSNIQSAGLGYWDEDGDGKDPWGNDIPDDLKPLVKDESYRFTATNSIAIGTDSKAEARDTTTIGRQSQALMANATAYGNNSHANAVNSIAIGNKAIAGRQASIFEVDENGNYTQTIIEGKGATADSAVAIGNRATALSEFSVALGVSSYVDEKAVHSVALGDSNRATGRYSTAVGAGESYYHIKYIDPITGEIMADEPGNPNSENERDVYDAVYANQANGDFSTAVGYVNRTVGENSTGVGKFNDVTGKDSLAIGSGNKINTVNVAKGIKDGKEADTLVDGLKQDNYVTGYAVGSENEIVGEKEGVYDGAYGHKNKVSGDNSYAMGNENEVEKEATEALAIGNKNKVFGKEAIAMGNGNTVTGKQSIAVGYGHKINGNKSGAFGDPDTVDADGSYVVGNDSTVEDGSDESFVMGNKSTASAKRSMIFGNESKVSGEGGIVAGSKSEVSSKDSVAIGNNAKATMENSVALGSGSETTHMGGLDGKKEIEIPGTHTKYTNIKGESPVGTVSVGTPGKERTITNVAAGRIGPDSTDAVNGSELYAVEQKVAANTQDIVNLNNKYDDLDTRINKIGAGAAALAGLHPLDFDPDEKWDFAASLGSYRNEQAVALGAFYRPNEDTMFSIAGTIGDGRNMVNVGVSWKFGQKNRISANRISSAKEIIELRKNQENVHSFLADAVAGNQLDLSKIQLFPDVEENHWAYDYVATMAGNGVLEGYPDGYFKGNRNMTRYEMAAVLYRLMQNGARLSDRALTEFAPELDRIRVDTITHHKDGTPHIQRVRTIKERVEEKEDPAQVADEKAEKERLAQEKKAAVQAEKERLAQEKAEAKAEKERLAQEKAEAKAEKERLAQEKKAEEKAAKEKAALEKKAEEQAAKEKLAQEKAEAKAAKEKAAEEKKAAAKAAKEKAAQEKAAAKAAKAKAE